MVQYRPLGWRYGMPLRRNGDGRRTMGTVPVAAIWRRYTVLLTPPINVGDVRGGARGALGEA